MDPKAKKLKKDADLEKQEYTEGDEEQEEMEEGEELEASRKSLVTEMDLEKSLELLGDLVNQNDPTSRKDQLLTKAQTGDLSADERDELFNVLGGSRGQEASMGTDIVKSIKTNETISKALDVSDYLEAQHGELVKALSDVGDRVEASDTRQHEFNLVLAKAIVETGKLVKAMSTRLGVITQQPAHAPKSRGVSGVVPLHKSFAGGPAEDQLSKSMILGTMEKMAMASPDGIAPCGEDLAIAVAKYEQTNMVSKALLNDIQTHCRTQA